MKKTIITLLLICLSIYLYVNAKNPTNKTPNNKITVKSNQIKCGDSIGSHNGITAYYNDGFNSCGLGRHMSSDGYSYGFKWQCVEYIRRYYKDYYKHEMSRWGNASDYFRNNLAHGAINTERNLIQYKNGHTEKPKEGDILVFQNIAPPYGHVRLVTKVNGSVINVIEQNTGTSCYSTLGLSKNGNNWLISDECTGFLRKEE